MTIKNKKKIGIDIDEVVAGFIERFLEYANQKNGTSFGFEDVHSYHLWETPIHSSKEESVSEVMEFQNSSHFEKVGLIEGAREVILEIAKTNNIYFVTSRPTEIKEKTEKFLKQNFNEIDFEIIHSGEIYGGKPKSEICRDLGLNFMVEDNPHYALDCAEKGVRVFLLNKPWNRDYSYHDNITKIKDWNEILNHIEKE